MGVLNDFTEKATGVVDAAVDKAKSMASVMKLNVAIAGEQKEIDKNCLEIGKWFVSNYNGEIPEGVKDLVDAVNASKAKIAELEAEKQETSKRVKDAESADAEDAADAEPAGKPCPICGEVSSSKFCPHCGAPMGD